MARNKIGLQVTGLDEYMAKLDKLGGGTAMKRGVEDALRASKQYVNPLIDQAMVKSNMPAKKAKKGAGAYWTGGTKESLDKDMAVTWEGMTASVKVGFDFSKSGMKSIFLMYGTPQHDPVAGLKDAIYGSKTNKAIAKLQGEALDKAIDRIMEE